MPMVPKQWQAESDARTLADANVIRGDQARLSAAQTAAQRMAKEEEGRLQGLKSVAKGGKASSNTSPVKPAINVRGYWKS